MKKYLALFEDKYFVSSRSGETLEEFLQRVDTCFGDLFYTVVECIPVYPKH